MKIRSLKLQKQSYGDAFETTVKDHWDYDDFKHGPTAEHSRWRTGWISFDCAVYEPTNDRIYAGITSFDADIFRAYDRKTDRFIDLDYARVVDPYDAKFHRSLERAPDGTLYAGIALLHCSDHYLDAPGGALLRYDPRTGTMTKLGIPMPHAYIQSIALDTKRETIYAMMIGPEKLCSFNLRTGQVKDFGLIGIGIGGLAQGENLCLDDAGGVWCGWQLTRAWQHQVGPDCNRLCKIDPDQQKIIYYQHGLPRPDGEYGTVKVEGLFNLGDGAMYASGGNGSIFRIDPSNGKAECIARPITDRPSRLTSLAVAKDGYAYGVTGRNGDCRLLRFDFRRDKFELVGDRLTDADGEPLWQCHQLIIADDGVMYGCENDVPHRSGYLWEISNVG